MIKIIILAAGSPHNGSEPTLLKNINGKSTLDWQINSFDKIKYSNLEIIVGFDAKKLKGLNSSSITITENKEWETSKSAESLFKADLEGVSELWITYGDIVFFSNIVEMMRKSTGDVVIAYDSDWKTRYFGRKDKDILNAEKLVISTNIIQKLGNDINIDFANGEFVGLVCLRGNSLVALREIQNGNLPNFKELTLPNILELIRLKGFKLSGVNIKGHWAELNNPSDLAHFIMGTKAETLSRLQSMVKKSYILDSVFFNVEQWKSDQESLINMIKSKFNCNSLIVRSSSLSEDSFEETKAGRYTSVLNVIKDYESIKKSVNKVIESYENLQTNDQVLIQPMFNDAVISGVSFTRSLEYAAPYYIINYDDTGSTESITSGKASKNKVFYFNKSGDINKIKCPLIKKLVNAIREIELILSYDALDIEFAVDKNRKIYIFQVRPIKLNEQIPEQLDEKISLKVKQSESLFNDLNQSCSNIVGESLIFSNMTDWNPAEIIGTNPGKLAFSLYNYLILDDVWALQRAQCGYRDVRPCGLLYNFMGKPYIDVRLSLNSFISNSYDDDLSKKLVNFYSDWLLKNPQLHDKIEFDVVPTCIGSNFQKWEKRFKQKGNFKSEEIDIIKNGLIEVTNNIITRIDSDLDEISFLTKRIDFISKNEKVTLRNIKKMIDECKIHGTLPFAHLARAGFVAITFLKEAVESDIISEKAKEDFLASINNITKTLSADAYLVKEGKMTFEKFVQKYGHLRPGTYDVTSQAYHEDPKRFLSTIIENSSHTTEFNQMNSWEIEKYKLFDELNRAGVKGNAKEIERFMRLAISGREKAKFVFSKGLSIAIDNLIFWSSKNGLSREEISNLSISRFFELIDQQFINNSQIKFLKEESFCNQVDKNLNLKCLLPPIISSINDFSFFTLNESNPNYIGSKKIQGDTVNLISQNKDTNLRGKIVMIPQADPGFDWLFGQEILGLITMYGGANSHMAIRAAEFRLTSAIGIGENLYSKFSVANRLELDPINEVIRILNQI
ncbi:PEP-utilizing enzyme [Flavobacteriaceae bacterium]|nr:PEP-utilizing enzyme [Flavobacteriaceae bacterium]